MEARPLARVRRQGHLGLQVLRPPRGGRGGALHPGHGHQRLLQGPYQREALLYRHRHVDGALPVRRLNLPTCRAAAAGAASAAGAVSGAAGAVGDTAGGGGDGAAAKDSTSRVDQQKLFEFRRASILFVNLPGIDYSADAETVRFKN